MLITVLGPDGSGKTTLSKKIEQQFDGVAYEYFGYNPESRRYRYFADFINSDLNNNILRFLRKIVVYLNDLDLALSAKNRIVVSDRHPIDSYVGSTINNKKALNHYAQLTLLLLPVPNFVVLLGGDPSEIHKRKQDLSVDLIAKANKIYVDFLTRKGVRFVSIDTVENDSDAVLNIAAEHLLKIIP
jgi:thymidylate kinase